MHCAGTCLTHACGGRCCLTYGHRYSHLCAGCWMIDTYVARYHERLSSRAPPPPPGSPPFRAAPRPPTPLAPRAAPLASGALLCRAEASEAEDVEAIETFNAAFNRRDSGGRGLIDTEDVKEVLRDLGVVREVGLLLHQFDVRRSAMYPYNQV